MKQLGIEIADSSVPTRRNCTATQNFAKAHSQWLISATTQSKQKVRPVCLASEVSQAGEENVGAG